MRVRSGALRAVRMLGVACRDDFGEIGVTNVDRTKEECVMNRIAFNSASLVAREVNYSIKGDVIGLWPVASAAVERYFQPVETFSARFSELLDEIVSRGFDCVDLWLSHLNWTWATDGHIQAAREALGCRELTVVSLAGSFGGTAAEVVRACTLAKGLGCTLLGGKAGLLWSNPGQLQDVLAEQGVTFAYENHPERSAAETLERLGDTDPDLVGVAVDTGWYGTQGCDAAAAIASVGERLKHVHLKDVKSEGRHETCAFGSGIVPLERCVRELKRLGYDGPVSIEHNAGGFDPGEEMAESRKLLVRWLAA